MGRGPSRARRIWSELCEAALDLWCVKWSPETRRISWLLKAVIAIAAIGSFLFSLELVILAPDPAQGASQVLQFVAIFGTRTWGVLQMCATLLFIVGVLWKKQLLVALGSGASTAVWLGYATALLQGAAVESSGYRSVVSALVLVSLWAIVFKSSLPRLRGGE